MAIRARIP